MTWLGNQSKKLWVALVGAVLIILRDSFGLSEQVTVELTALAASYLLGQGIADFGKGRSQVEKSG